MSSLFARLLLVTLMVAQSADAGWAREAPKPTVREYDDEGDPSDDELFGNLARFRPTPEQRLSNGVSWRLFVDTVTGAAMPRITWMPWRDSMSRANEMFEAMHGSLMRDAYRAGRENWIKVPPWGYKTIFKQGVVELTYASRRFIAYHNQGLIHWSYRGVDYWNHGSVFDLDDGTTLDVKACPGAERPYGETDLTYYSQADLEDRFDDRYYDEKRKKAPRHFIFGELMRVCDDESYAAFRALVVQWAAKAVKENAARRVRAERGAWAKALLQKDHQMLLVLTTSGLALHTFENRADTEPRFRCVGGQETPNPVVIPYRDLSPFLRPGPLRDELLK